MANAYHVRIIIPTLSAVNDNASWNFAFQDITGSGTAGNTSDLAAAAVSFVNTAAAGATLAIAKYIHNSADRGTNHASVVIYNITTHLNGSPAGSPVAIVPFTIGAIGTASPNPEGVACALSFRADYGTDVEFGTGTRPRARDRNRVYLGPLSGSVLANEATTNRTVFSTTFQTDILHALFAFADITVSSTPTFALRAWSRKAAALKLVTTAWVDDRPDYQRRRTDPSAVRSTLAMPAV